MDVNNLQNCPGTLVAGFSSYSPLCLRRVFGGRRVSHVLPFFPPEVNEETAEAFVENRKHLSISGGQEKLSMVLDGNKLRLAHEQEHGEYILKPVPRDLKKIGQAPMNEHLTMQIAAQVYGITTAANVLVFFKDGTPAYLTKRFDLKADGSKWGSEDFASLAGRTSENAGVNFKYDYSYEALGNLLKRYIPAWRVEIEKLFSLVVFNYLFSNGDAHLKNFSVLESQQGDYLLSPAYDLLNTHLHVDDTDFALSKGLFEDDFRSAAFQKQGHPSYADFVALGQRWDMSARRVEKILQQFVSKQDAVEKMIANSFLNQATQRSYLQAYQTRCNFLKN